MNKIKLKKIIKIAGYGVVGTVLTFSGLLGYLAYKNNKIEKQFKKNIRECTVTSQQLLNVAPKQKNFYLNPENSAELAIGSILLYQPTPKIAAKAAHVTNSEGKPFIINDGDKTKVWNSYKHEYNDLTGLYKVQDSNKVQLASYYNLKTNEVIWAWGGTDFSSFKDLMAGGQTIAGGLGDRVLSADKSVDSVLIVLKEKFPSVNPKSVKHTAFMHSTGVQSFSASYLGFARNSISYDAAYAVDGFGAHRAFTALAEAIVGNGSGNKDKTEIEKQFDAMTKGIVAFDADNEMDILGKLKNTDPFNIVGKEKDAGRAIGGTIIDMGKTKHQAFNFTNAFAKLGMKK